MKPNWIRENDALRAGLKCALAGTLAFATAAWLGLAMPHWAALTVMLLMSAEFVGAVWEKSVLRLAGSLTGAAIGVIAFGWWAEAPWAVYLMTGTTLLIGALGWKGNWYPYAFLLMGVTQLLMVAGIPTFQMAPWQAGFERVTEIAIGVVASMLVTRFVWPRYAREVFQHLYRDTLQSLGDYLEGRLRGHRDLEQNLAFAREFAMKMNRLGQLLHSGGRESRAFATRIPAYRSLLSEIQLLYESARSLGSQPLLKTSFAPHLTPELEEAVAAVELLLKNFACSSESPDLTAQLECRHALETLGLRVAEVRKTGVTRNIPIEETLDYSASFVGLHEIADRLDRIAHVKTVLSTGPDQLAPDKISQKWLQPNAWPFAWRNVFIGLSALWLIQSFPSLPGGPLVPIVAVVISLLTTNSADHTGDALVWQRYAEWLAGAGLLMLAGPAILSALAFPPFYWLFLFTGLVLFGVFAQRGGGLTLRLKLALFLFPGTLALGWKEISNPEVIISMLSGLLIGLFYATFWQRLIFPELPIKRIRAGWIEMIASCRQLIQPLDDRHRDEAEVELVLNPMIVRTWIGALRRLHRRDLRIQHYEPAIRHLESASYLLATAAFPSLAGLSEEKAAEAGTLLQAVRDCFDQELAALLAPPTLERSCDVTWRSLKTLTLQVESWRFDLFDHDLDQFDYWIPLMTAVGRLQLARQKLTAARLEWLEAIR